MPVRSRSNTLAIPLLSITLPAVYPSPACSSKSSAVTLYKYYTRDSGVSRNSFPVCRRRYLVPERQRQSCVHPGTDCPPLRNRAKFSSASSLFAVSSPIIVSDSFSAFDTCMGCPFRKLPFPLIAENTSLRKESQYPPISLAKEGYPCQGNPGCQHFPDVLF